MKNIYCFIFVISLMVLVNPINAYAADDKPKEILEEEVKTPKTMEEKIKEIEMKIVDDFYDMCTQNSMSGYYDCKCLAIRYLDEYKLSVGTLTHSAILRKLSKECPNKIAMAGRTYSQCVSISAGMRKDYDQFCTCVANKFVKRISKNMNTNSQYHIKIKSEIFTECGYAEGLVKLMKRSKAIQEAANQQTFFPDLDDSE